MKKYPIVFFKMLFIIIGILTISCNNDDTPIVYKEGSNEYINDWIYEQMEKYYYWNDDMPSSTNLSLNPKDYFGKLLNTNDRFSYAVENSSPETFPKSIIRTYGFDLSFIEHDGEVFGAVLFVLTDSPAERSGLKRGQLIKSVNGILLSNQNFENLYLDLVNSEQVQLQVVEYTLQAGFSPLKEIAVSRGLTFSQPIVYHVISNNSEKTGYIAIPHFDVGLAPVFLQIFKEFQNQSVTKVIVDLRYNGGGDVSSATALSIILAPNIKSNDLFIRFKGNKNGGLVDKSFKEALEMNEFQTSFETLREVHPKIQQLYVLCGSHTASAAEIIINNLKPYLSVITIGKKTVGKDVAGFAIEDNRATEVSKWVLYPVIYKLFNANNEGNYAAGINPSVELNELQQLEIFPLGDAREVLVNQALNGELNTKKNTPSLKILQLKAIYSTADPLLKIDLE